MAAEGENVKSKNRMIGGLKSRLSVLRRGINTAWRDLAPGQVGEQLQAMLEERDRIRTRLRKLGVKA